MGQIKQGATWSYRKGSNAIRISTETADSHKPCTFINPADQTNSAIIATNRTYPKARDHTLQRNLVDRPENDLHRSEEEDLETDKPNSQANPFSEDISEDWNELTDGVLQGLAETRIVVPANRADGADLKADWSSHRARRYGYAATMTNSDGVFPNRDEDGAVIVD